MPATLSRLLPLAGCLVAALLLAVLPQWLDLFTLLSLSVYLVMALLALSLAFIWGFGGILCFGQAAFFGLGAYAYAIGVLNLGDSTWPVLLATGLAAERVTALLRKRSVRLAGGLLVILFGLWTLPGPHQHWLMGH